MIRQAVPLASNAEIIEALQITGVPVNDSGYTIPRIQVDAAISYLLERRQPLLSNGNFEAKLTDWSGKHLAGDRVKCDLPKRTIAYDGRCTLRMRGSAEEKAKLQQNVNLDGVDYQAGDTLQFRAHVNAGSPDTKAKLRVMVKYANGRVDVLPVTIAPTDGFEPFGGELEIRNDNIEKIKVVIINRSKYGVMFVDNVQLSLVRNQVPTDIPLPEPPTNDETSPSTFRNN